MNLMDCVESWKVRAQHNTERMRQAVQGVDEETLNQRPDSNVWSPAQVIEHLVITNRKYLPAMEKALQRSKPTSSVSPVWYSPVGVFLHKAAGPGGNAPVPPMLNPRTSNVPLSIVAEWEEQDVHFMSLLDQAASVDIAGTRLWNPLIPLLPMNLADCFELTIAHTDHHVSQIVARVRRPT
jgi:uncharacterized damage-inducible protein DinB